MNALFGISNFTLTDSIISKPTRGTPIKLPRRSSTHAYWRQNDSGRKDFDWLLKIECTTDAEATAHLVISDTLDDTLDDMGMCIAEVNLNRHEISRVLPGRLFSMLNPADELWIRLDVTGHARVKATIERVK